MHIAGPTCNMVLLTSSSPGARLHPRLQDTCSLQFAKFAVSVIIVSSSSLHGMGEKEKRTELTSMILAAVGIRPVHAGLAIPQDGLGVPYSTRLMHAHSYVTDAKSE